ncbi:MAG: class II fructose-bisphosphate aldolase [Candidatus Pacebacteria bacterium]|nr:class II fructose-bisphosphate aldolase [Candidatus Paceibacterota bacterium]
MQKTLRSYIEEARKEKRAIGHFNVSNLDAIHAIVEAAEELNVPIILGATEGEEGYIGTEVLAGIVSVLKQTAKVPVFLNADHHYSFESVKKSIDAGFDMAIIDLVKLPLEENIKITKQCVDYARKISKELGKDVLIEAELGFIGSSSKMLDDVPEGAGEETMTKPEDAKYFIDNTGIDLLAPSVGNIHGMVKSGEPALHPDRVAQIYEKTKVSMVLHGASGNTDEDVRACIEAGVAIVHINTEIRVAYKDALIESMTVENKDEIAPYKYLPMAKDAIKQVVLQKLKVFNNI